MPRKRSWTDEQLIEAVAASKSYRNVLILIGLVPAGGNYFQVQHRIKTLQIDTSHFTGMQWNKGLRYQTKNLPLLESLLVLGGTVQSYKLKKRLFSEGLKTPKCELCGWAERSIDGRVPLELDHINGDHFDNRIENLRILCPNCHSLQPTHRGKNKKVHLARVVE
ncbi:MAG TPA: HNH endonuclease signature motif containing protein [Candidatus Saccharimonadales bacterium]|nr:HNH endonuclease signature motif containing protein [Candidatus Saccharimonadales bacterium]